MIELLLIAQLAIPPMRPHECTEMARYLFWVADYRDVKADKEILKARNKGGARQELVDYFNAEIDRIYESKESGNEIANTFLKRCLAPKMDS